MSNWVPDAGDVIWLDLNPTLGREQTGRRPALVLSPAAYNLKTGLLIACAMTSKIKGYPFEVLLAPGSAVLVDQVRTVDWRSRKARFKNRVSPTLLTSVRTLLSTLLQLN